MRENPSSRSALNLKLNDEEVTNESLLWGKSYGADKQGKSDEMGVVSAFELREQSRELGQDGYVCCADQSKIDKCFTLTFFLKPKSLITAKI